MVRRTTLVLDEWGWSIHAGIAHGTLAVLNGGLWNWLWSFGAPRTGVFILVLVHVFAGLAVASSHANITADTNTAALLSDNPAESGALGESRKLLSTVYGEGAGLYF
jgi:hypothetical protein